MYTFYIYLCLCCLLLLLVVYFGWDGGGGVCLGSRCVLLFVCVSGVVIVGLRLFCVWAVVIVVVFVCVCLLLLLLLFV